MAQHRGWLGAWGLCALSWLACGDTNSSETTTATGEKEVSVQVGGNGARLELASGVKLDVPQDALGQPVKVELEELRSTALPEQPAAQALEKAVAFRPHGQKFDRDVVIEMPIDSVPAGKKVRLLRLDDEQDTSWEEIVDFTVRDATDREKQASDSRQRVSFKARHFSVYWPVAGQDEDASTPSLDAGMGEADATTASDAGTVDADATTASDAGMATQLPDSGAEASDAGATTSQDSGTLDAGGTDAGTDAGAAAMDSGAIPDAAIDDAGTPADASTGGTNDAALDAGPPDAGDTCQAAFDAISPALNCTSDPSAQGYGCEGFVGANSANTCSDFCTSWGGYCVAVYPSAFLMCGAYNTDAGSGSCTSLGDYYCVCSLP